MRAFHARCCTLGAIELWQFAAGHVGKLSEAQLALWECGKVLMFSRLFKGVFELATVSPGHLHRTSRSFEGARYSITSSASASIFGGMSNLSAFAVARLKTNWKRVGSSTGNSPGFSPFKILPT